MTAKNYDIRRDAAHPNEFTQVYPLLDLSKGYYASTSKYQDFTGATGRCQEWRRLSRKIAVLQKDIKAA
ncbi:hypothetical protein [Desulfosporosinus fructosivorans]|uniref:hypothetical protein n=1 Tax=Desulfosporosinus fructosivorans TaxID=2018669 RepID=UPI001FB05FAF|nr:hypothetical protein [Desulfosporosinus fructosivorans]